jgi:hypothetical protein
LLLDEATNALDIETEQALFKTGEPHPGPVFCLDAVIEPIIVLYFV